MGSLLESSGFLCYISLKHIFCQCWPRATMRNKGPQNDLYGAEKKSVKQPFTLFFFSWGCISPPLLLDITDINKYSMFTWMRCYHLSISMVRMTLLIDMFILKVAQICNYLNSIFIIWCRTHLAMQRVAEILEESEEHITWESILIYLFIMKTLKPEHGFCLRYRKIFSVHLRECHLFHIVTLSSLRLDCALPKSGCFGSKYHFQGIIHA